MSCSDGAVEPMTTILLRKAEAGTWPRSTGEYETEEIVPGGPAKSIHAFDPPRLDGEIGLPSAVSAVRIDRVRRPSISYGMRRTTPPGSAPDVAVPRPGADPREDRSASEDTRLSVRPDLGGRQYDPTAIARDRVDQRIVLRGRRRLGELDVEDDHARPPGPDPVEQLRVQGAGKRPLPLKLAEAGRAHPLRERQGY